VPYAYREAWLAAAVEHFKPDFEAQSYPLQAQVRVTCGWPSRGALAPKVRRMGECWSTTASADGANEIFISPLLAEPIEVGSVLVHELVHAAVGPQWGHQKPFRSLAVKMGLLGPMRSTTANPLLRERLNALSQQLGPYPHATLDARDRKKQGTRLLRCACPSCGYIARITQRWIAFGLPVCPCGTSLVPSWHLPKPLPRM
jgi:hypothetical protein